MTTETRTCAGCGIPEERTATTVNLDPVFSLCVDCLVAFSHETKGEPPRVREPFDPKRAQTGERE